MDELPWTLFGIRTAPKDDLDTHRRSEKMLNQQSITKAKTTDSFTRIQKAPKVEGPAIEETERKKSKLQI